VGLSTNCCACGTSGRIAGHTRTPNPPTTSMTEEQHQGPQLDSDCYPYISVHDTIATQLGGIQPTRTGAKTPCPTIAFSTRNDTQSTPSTTHTIDTQTTAPCITCTRSPHWPTSTPCVCLLSCCPLPAQLHLKGTKKMALRPVLCLLSAQRVGVTSRESGIRAAYVTTLDNTARTRALQLVEMDVTHIRL
jgi:hypothetical protein